MKLNKKGMTTVEILVSFAIIAVISSTLFTTINSYNTKRQYESYNLEINTYKNILTKTIQDDLIKKGVINAKKKQKVDNNCDVFIVDIELKDRSLRRLVVKRRLTNDPFSQSAGDSGNVNNPVVKANETPRNYDDYFMILYGTPTDTNIESSNYSAGLESFPVPDLGFSYNQNKKIGAGSNRKVMDLRLTNVNIDIANQVLSIFVGFDHVELGSKYAINIVCPINYQVS